MSGATAIRVQLGDPDSGWLDAWLDEAGNLVVPAAALPRGLGAGESIVLAHGPGRSDDCRVTRRCSAAIAAATLSLIALLAIMAVHGRQWSWSGFAGSTSLWDWLRLFAQPIALVVMTIRLVSGGPTRRRRAITRIGLVLFALLIFAGYTEHWGWTGFSGKQLWDWLTLLLFPAAAVLLPEWARRGARFDANAGVFAGLAAGAFGVLVLGGYRWGWTWTGFSGNTFRDWLELMIAPFLLPVTLKLLHTLHVMRPMVRERDTGAHMSAAGLAPASKINGLIGPLRWHRGRDVRASSSARGA